MLTRTQTSEETTLSQGLLWSAAYGWETRAQPLPSSFAHFSLNQCHPTPSLCCFPAFTAQTGVIPVCKLGAVLLVFNRHFATPAMTKPHPGASLLVLVLGSMQGQGCLHGKAGLYGGYHRANLHPAMLQAGLKASRG